MARIRAERNSGTRSRARAALMLRAALLGVLLAGGLGAPRAGAASPVQIEPGISLRARGPDGAELGACPLERSELRAQIAGFAVRGVLVQRFANPHSTPIEAVYSFPLPASGAVDHVLIRSGEREIRAQIARREDARQRYESARRAGQLAALLDEERPNVFTQSVANLAPGVPIEVEIHYVAPLEYKDGAFEMVFPTVVGPRFVPGAPLGHSGSGRLPDTDQVPDASRITPPVAPAGARAGHDVTIQVDIEAGVPLGHIESPLHAIDVVRRGETRARVSLREGSALPDRDFVLRYQVAGETLRSGFLAHRSESGDGYVSVLLVPPKPGAAQRAAPRELVFVVDRSGSQSGPPLQKAKETLLWMLERLEPADTFQIVSFGNQTEELFERPERASAENLLRARNYIAALQANGGTWMGPAVERICAMPAEPGRLRIVTFMTDGYVGNDLEVLELVRKLRGGSRWFPFGTGNSVNRFLLERMAQLGGGEVEYVLLSDSGERSAEKFARRIAAPLLTDVRIEAQGVELTDIYPAEPADVWAQRPLLLHARYRAPGRGRVVLRGFAGGEPYEQTLELHLPRRRSEDAAIRSLWARARVDSLLVQDLAGLQSGSFPAALREAVVAVALEHDLLTPFTSFVAVDEAGPRQPGAPGKTVPVPVELPQGVSPWALGEGGSSGVVLGALSGAASAQSAPAPAGPARSARLASEAPAAAAQIRAQVEKLQRAPIAADEATAVAPRPPHGSSGALALDYRQLWKLGPRLQALVKNGAPATPLLDGAGRLRLQLALGDLGAETLAALARCGFRLQSQEPGGAVGTLAPEQLEALARLDAVRRIELAPAAAPAQPAAPPKP